MTDFIKVGIEKIGIYIPEKYIDLSKLAEHRGIDPLKWTEGIGQERMSIMTKDQDVVSMGANACLKILDDEDKKTIDQVIFATESALDFSKASSTYIHKLLGIQPFAKSYEIKQACYSATAAIQVAADYVRLRPDRKVIIIASDISKYGLKSSGEATQGAGAIAILISSNPKIMEITKESVSLTENSFDFWRPSYSNYPFVEGKFSTQLYIDSFIRLIEEFENRYPGKLSKVDALLFHLPFSKMGRKALKTLESKLKEGHISIEGFFDNFEKLYENYDKSIVFGKEIGNIYTGSLYLGLLSLLINGDLEGHSEVGLFSYGSGAVAELYIGKLNENYKDFLYREDIEYLLKRRNEISIKDYENEYFDDQPTQSQHFLENEEPKDLEEGYYLEKIVEDKRFYNFKEKI